MINIDMKTVRKSIAIYGLSTQMYVTIEELSELQKEVCKALREAKDNRASIVEELADVQIMLANLREIFKIEDEELESVIRYKQSRLEERMKSK